jgi:hypothetical protein
MGGECESWGKRVSKKGQNKLLGRGAMDFSTEEGRRVKGMSVDEKMMTVKLIV